MFSLTPRD